MLVGRDSERQAIDRLVSTARLGSGGALVLTGEPGVGKTALVREAAAELTEMRLLHAIGSESEREIPFGGLSALLRPALPLLDRIPVPQADALGAALALRPGRAADRFAVGAATLSLLCRYAENRPVVVLVDDLHLWDRPSAEALVFAGHRLGADSVAVLATARSAELTGAERDLPRLEINGLDPAAAAELVAAHSAAFVPPDLMARLHRATAGNPLALLELAGDLVRLERTSPDSPAPVSAALARAFTLRARELSSPARSALVALAAAGGDLRLTGICCAALGFDLRSLAEAETAQLIAIGDDRADFRHPLVRSAVYSDAAPERRRQVHRALADALPAGDIDRRAWHLAESSLGPDPAVADLLDRAGQRARERSAHAVASAAYERAAGLSPEAADRASRMVLAAESAWRGGQGGRALGLLDAVAAGDPSAAPGGSERELRTLELRAAIAQRTGEPAQAQRLFRAAADLAADPDRAATLLSDTIYASYYLGDVGAAMAAAGQLEALSGRLRTARGKALSSTASGAARVLANAGGEDQLRSGLAQLGALAEPDDGRALTWLLTGLLFMRDVTSQAEIQRRVDQARADAAIGVLPLVLFLLARDAATTDRWPRAEATYTESIALARESGNMTDLAMSLGGLAWLLAREGRESDTIRLVAEAREVLRERRLPVAEVWVLSAEGELDLALGRPAEAAARHRELQRLLDLLRIDDPDLSPAPDLTDALVHLGKADDATDVAAQFHRNAAAKGRPWGIARAERAVGMCAPDAVIDRHFAAALLAHSQTADRFEEARTRLAYGERLRRARRRTESRPHLRAALAAFEDLTAKPWADRAAHELAATGEIVDRRAEPHAASLTPQELQISLLLVEGRTTREVAAALFLSPKTVEYHLRKVYTKLGVRSRGELAGVLPR